MRRSRGQNDVQVEVYRGNEIYLNKVTSKFLVAEIAEIEPCDTLQAAKNAIDRHIAAANKGVRRKVLTFKDRYYRGEEEVREIRVGELTSWTRPRGYSRLEGVVVYGKNSRDNVAPDDIFEDTQENRVLMERVRELDRQAIKAKKEAARIIEKELKRAAVPEHFKAA